MRTNPTGKPGTGQWPSADHNHLRQPRRVRDSPSSGHTQSDRCACWQAGDMDTQADGCVGRSRRGQPSSQMPRAFSMPCPAMNGMTNRDCLDPKPGWGRLCGQAPPPHRQATCSSFSRDCSHPGLGPEPRADGACSLLPALPTHGWGTACHPAPGLLLR